MECDYDRTDAPLSLNALAESMTSSSDGNSVTTAKTFLALGRSYSVLKRLLWTCHMAAPVFVTDESEAISTHYKNDTNCLDDFSASIRMCLIVFSALLSIL